MFKSLIISESGFKKFPENSVYIYNYSVALILDNCKDFDTFIEIISSLDFDIKYTNYSVVCYEGEFELKGDVACLNFPVNENYGICIVNHNFSDSKELLEQITFKTKGHVGFADIYTGSFNYSFISNSFKAFSNCLFSADKSICFYKKLSYRKCDDLIKNVVNSVEFGDFDNAKSSLSDMKFRIISNDFSVEESIFILKNLYRIFCEDYGYAEKELIELSLFNFSLSCYDDSVDKVVSIIEDVSKKAVKNRLYKYNTIISDVIEFINANYSTDIKLRDVAEHFSLKPGYLSILFKNVYKCTFTQYITNLRMEKAKDMLRNTNFSIGEIYDEVGYTDYYSFIKAFKKNVGVSPTVYRRNN